MLRKYIPQLSVTTCCFKKAKKQQRCGSLDQPHPWSSTFSSPETPSHRSITVWTAGLTSPKKRGDLCAWDKNIENNGWWWSIFGCFHARCSEGVLWGVQTSNLSINNLLHPSPSYGGTPFQASPLNGIFLAPPRRRTRGSSWSPRSPRLWVLPGDPNKNQGSWQLTDSRCSPMMPGAMKWRLKNFDELGGGFLGKGQGKR